MSPFEVIKTVRLTEKVMAVQERCDEMAELAAQKKGGKAVIRQQVHLVANPAADKNDIRRAVEILFKVKVDRVNTMNIVDMTSVTLWKLWTLWTCPRC